MPSPLTCERIVGAESDEGIRARIHDLAHRDAIEIIRLSRSDLARHRLRTVTDKGSDCAIVLDRSARLFDGAVLLLDDRRAIVVRAEPESWLIFKAKDVAGGLELGYFAGNMHWAVRFEGDLLYVSGQVGVQHVLDRLRHLLQRDQISYMGDER
jgi:urease accessory protein